MTQYKTVMLTVVLVTAIAVGGFIIMQVMRGQPDETAVITPLQSNNAVRYLPLGDSYTIGQSVAADDRWPNQLARTYKPGGKDLSIVANPSVTGYTTQDLIDNELPLVQQLKPDFVTVLIGVNDYVQDVSEQTFRTNLQSIITYLQAEMTKPQNILLITIPDYAKTPAGAQYGDPVVATAQIQRFNQIIIDTAAKAKLPYADIFGASQQVLADATLTASDGLHPSGRQYAVWSGIIRQSLESAGMPE